MKFNFAISDLKNTACWKLNQHLAEPVGKKKVKQSKYNNTIVEFDGKTFHSIKERDRYITLRHKQGMEEIRDLACQVEFILESEDRSVFSYIADFVYTDCKTGANVVEDVKSPATRKLATYRMKHKMMQAKGIEIKEV